MNIEEQQAAYYERQGEEGQPTENIQIDVWHDILTFNTLYQWTEIWKKGYNRIKYRL
jgi:hypothetical protein